MEDFEAVELAGVVDQFAEDGEDWSADAESVDADAVVKGFRWRG